MKKTLKRGVNWVLFKKKKKIKHSKFKHKRSKYREIELEKSNSPQASNRVRIPLT